jgi:hypothetical protein
MAGSNRPSERRSVTLLPMSSAAYDDFGDHMSRGGSASLRLAGSFFMKGDPVFQTLRSITSRLKELEIPYAVVGGMALVAHGYDRTTTDVNILLTPADLQKVHTALDGFGYVRPFPGSKHLKDGTTKVRVEFLTTGSYPGDGKPKPVAFPEPAGAAVDIDGIRYLKLDTLIELKLASGMTNTGRLKDLADVQELIRVLKLGRSYDGNLNPYVRAKFLELWDGVEGDSVSD